jgi:hypothetical protein
MTASKWLDMKEELSKRRGNIPIGITDPQKAKNERKNVAMNE